MANYKGRRVARQHDEWYFYDQLPSIVKLRIAGATLPWSCASILDRYRKHKAKHGRAAALVHVLDLIENSDRYQAWERPWTGKGKNAEPTPCCVSRVEPMITHFSMVR